MEKDLLEMCKDVRDEVIDKLENQGIDLSWPLNWHDFISFMDESVCVTAKFKLYLTENAGFFRKGKCKDMKKKALENRKIAEEKKK